jgi:osmotically-inducible protein OsmY
LQTTKAKMTTEDQSLTDSVKPEDQVPASTPAKEQVPSTEVANQADKSITEPETSTGKSDAEPQESRANARIRQLVEERKQALAKLSEAEEQAKFFKQQAEALKPRLLSHGQNERGYG